VSCSAADSHANASRATFTVHVKGAREQLDQLIRLVRTYNLKPGVANRLLAHLISADRKLALSRQSACQQLDGVVRAVKQLRERKDLAAAQSSAILSATTRIEAVVPCPNVRSNGGLRLSLGVKSGQRIGKHGQIVLTARCLEEACRVTAQGTINVPGAARLYRFRTASARLTKGKWRTLKPRLTESARRPVTLALGRRRSLRARFRVLAVDGFGDRISTKRVIRVRN
jgi:hypothetical protein